MVIGFSTFGYLFYIFSSRLEEEMKMIELARKYFPYIVLPQIAMLFYALYLRIAQYDVTMNRYFVAVFGLWLCVISLYYIFSQKKYLIFIPAVFAIFTLLISIGPWSVYDFPEYRQKQKLIENLTALHIYENGTIKALSWEYSNEDLENQAYSWISYLCSLNNCKSIKELFPEQYEAFLIQHKEQFEKDTAQWIEDNKNYPEWQKYWNEREYTLPQPWEIVAAITSALGIDIYRSGESYTSYSLGEAWFFPLSVQGYDMIIPVTQSKVNEKIYGKYDEWQETLQIYDGENIIESISLGNYFMELNKSETLLNNAMSPESMTYTFTGQRFDGKILFESISIQDNTLGQESTDSNIQYMSGYISGYVLLKQK